MAPQELLQEFKQAQSTEYLGCFKTDAGDEYDIEIAHEDGADLYLMQRLDTETTEFPSSNHKDPRNLRAAIRCVEIETDKADESHPVHLDVLSLAPQLPAGIKTDLLKTVLKDVDERYPLSAHGAEVDLDAEVADEHTQKIFEGLGFTAITHTDEHIVLVKPAELDNTAEETAETPHSIAA